MKNRRAFILCLVTMVPTVPLAAQSAGNSPATPPQAVTGIRGELVNELGEFERKAVRLAEAIPQEKFNWRPGEGVRSIGEVITHIAQTNYTFPNIMGVRPPAEADVPGIGKLTEKEKMVAALKASFEHARKVLGGFSDADLERSVRENWTVRRTAMFMLRHGLEHTGQLIAYARMVGITPPWTEEAQQRQRQQPPKQ